MSRKVMADISGLSNVPRSNNGRGAALKVTDLTCGYGSTVVIHGVSFDVPTGALLGIRGPNGAGKTTLLNAIAGHSLQCRGEVLLNGQRYDQAPAHKRVAAGLALVPEGRQIIGSISVQSNLDLTLMSRGRLRFDEEHRRRLRKVLELFPRLADRLDVAGRVLSGGEQQMLAIARALMTNPQVLLLDEPSQGLAPSLVEVVVATLEKLKGTISIVLVEQHQDVLDALADSIVTLSLGRLAERSAADVVSGYGAPGSDE